ncbi:MAG: hypothetical protein ABSG60_14525 [Terracidiphilus sp.]|jgi:hypothetical protein
MNDWCIIGVQHLLGTTGSLIQEILYLGAEPSNIYLLGKHYSTNQDVLHELLRLGINVRVNRTVGKWGDFSKEFDTYVKQLWRDVRVAVGHDRKKGILILDDGGHCIASVPESLLGCLPIAGVEQTTSGVTRIGEAPSIPVVAVALSAAKSRIESPLISETVIKKMKEVIPPRRMRAGVIGLGNIGLAIASALLSRGDQVFGYDLNMVPVHGIAMCRNVGDLIAKSDFIFGCTGEDATGISWIDEVMGTKVFLSCSSEDREFRSLLTWLYRRMPSENRSSTDRIEVRLPRATIQLLRGGFPVNFDLTDESVPLKDIQVTRSLLLGGLAQASMASGSPGYIKLDSRLQRLVVQEWIEQFPERRSTYGNSVIDQFSDLKWISEHSGGGESSGVTHSLF